MLRFATIVLLCLTMLACPLSCWAGHCCGTSHAHAIDCCCCDSDAAEPGLPSDPGCDQQCLCKGAILADFAQPLAPVAVFSSASLPRVTAASGATEVADLHPGPDRDVCCLNVRLQV